MKDYAPVPEFVPDRCYHAVQRIVHREGYENESDKLRQNKDKLIANFSGEYERGLLDEILSHRDALLFMHEEACYTQGFRDCMHLIAGMRLEE